MTQQRRLATIMFTDVVGYTAAMARDERHAHALVDRAHEHVRAFVEHCGGQWLETVGDGSLSAFASASQAVDCALAIQDSLASDPELQLRIGLHVGDVVFSDEGVYGDGVNLASRVHALAPPGGTVVTEAIRTAIRGHANLRFSSLGRKRLKNVEEPVSVYRLSAGTSGPARWLESSGKRTAIVAAVLIVGAGSLAVFLATGKHQGVDISSDEPRRIAVLPFEHGKGESDEHFADGLTEELINALTQLKELRVTARTSAFHFKGKALPVAEIADRLDVDYVVEGMVRRSGERLRISAQLIRADEDFHLWSTTYDRELAGMFEIQQDIAEKVAASLDVLLDEEKRWRMKAAGTDDIEAFIAYRKGWKLNVQAHAKSDHLYPLLIEANSWFDRAIERDPDFAEAYVVRADLYNHLSQSKLFLRPVPKGVHDILPHAEQLLLNDLDKAYRAAVSESRRAAIEVNRTKYFGDWGTLPNKLDSLISASGCPSYALMDSLPPLGMARYVIASSTKRTECDPLNYDAWAVLAEALIWAGQPEEGLKAAQKGLSILDHERITDAQIRALMALRRYREAEQRIKTMVTGRHRLRFQIMVHASRNDLDQAKQIIERSKREYENRAPILWGAWVGDQDGANQAAARIDGIQLGHIGLAQRIWWCMCGAPFDLDATPNFKKRIEDAGIPWPPPSPIHFPAKEW